MFMGKNVARLFFRCFSFFCSLFNHRSQRFIFRLVLSHAFILPLLIMPFEQVAMASASLPQPHQRQSLTKKKSIAVKPGSLKGSGSGTVFHAYQNGIPLMANGEAALPSDAMNFHGGWNASVNARTGTPSFSMPVGNILYDNGQSKRDLVLSWSGSYTPGGANPFGIGAHWGWNVGTEQLSTSEVAGHMTTDITTGDGHSLTMESDRNAAGQVYWHPLRHHLKDVVVTGHPGDWTLAMASGVRKHIKNGYQDWEENSQGQRIWFYYDHDGSHDATRHLLYVCGRVLTRAQIEGGGNACAGHGLSLSYAPQQVSIHGLQTVKLYLTRRNGMTQAQDIVVPSLSSEGISNHGEKGRIHFVYDDKGNRPWLLRDITYPDGLQTTFLYNEESERSAFKSAGLPIGTGGRARLPVVTEQITHSLHGHMPDAKVWYRYDGGWKDRHNYTGYQGTGSMVPGRDNLLDRSDDYTYRVTRDNGRVSTTTVYNKYHLPLTTVRHDDVHDITLSHKQELFLPWRHTTFAQLPASYSLSRGSEEIFHTLTEKGADQSHSGYRVVQAKRYNQSGQMIWKRDAFGRQTFTQFCPQEGDRHCPQAQKGWPAGNRIEKVVTVPALSSGEPSGDIQETIYDYTRLPVASRFLQQVSKSLRGHRDAKAAGREAEPLKSFWQVSKKVTGTLPAEKVKGLKPGDALPEMEASDQQMETRFVYDRNPDSLSAGHLTQLTLKRFSHQKGEKAGDDHPLFHKSLLAQSLKPQEAITVNVITHIDPQTGTRTVTMKAASPGDRHELSGEKKAVNERSLMANRSGIYLGTRVFSLADGMKLSAHDTLGQMHIHWQYDHWRRPVKKVMVPENGGQPHVVSWHYIFTPKENAIVETDSEGGQTKTVMNVDRHVVSTWHRFRSQASASMEGLSNWIADTAYTYTASGKPASKTVWHAGDEEDGVPGKAIALTTTYGYDDLDRRVWTKTPDGQVMVTARDDAALRQIQYRVATGATGETMGPALKVTDTNVLGKPVAIYVLPLDPAFTLHGHPLYPERLQQQLNRLRSSLMPVSSLNNAAGYGLLPLSGASGLFAFVREAIGAGAWMTRTQTVYDGMGNRIRQTLANGATLKWIWHRGNVEASVLPDGSVIHDDFNIQAQKLSRCVQPSGSQFCHVLGLRGYDGSGQLAWQADESGHVIRYVHDDDGRLVSMTVPGTADHPQGHVFTYRYNSIGRVESALDGVVYARYHYDPVTWHMVDSEDGVSHTHYDYDADTGKVIRITRSHPVNITSVAGSDYPSYAMQFRWNRYLSMVNFVDMAGNVYYPQHDRLGRLTASWVRMKGSGAPVPLKRVSYDQFGRPATLQNGVGVTRLLAYDDMGRLASVTDRHHGRLIDRMDYQYDPETGNITRIEREAPDAKAVMNYRYDLRNNLTDMKCSGSGHSGHGSLCPREMAWQGSGLSAPPMILSQHYAFDRWNNISKVKEQVEDEHGHHLTKTVNYRYGEASEDRGLGDHGGDPHRMSAFQEQWSNQSMSVRPRHIEYDDLGRVIRDADGNRLYYNAMGRQSRFVNARTGEETRYVYDSQGHQVAMQMFSKSGEALQPMLYMVYAGDHVMAQVQKDRYGQVHVAMELGGLAHSEDGHINRWYLHDYKGDVITTLDAKGEVVSSAVYSPYGMMYNRYEEKSAGGAGQSSPWWKRLPGFDGQMTDPATGYQFLGGGYRAYNPVYRHFMAHDSYSPFIKIDGYGFGDNNPVMNTDPSGHMSSTVGYALAGAMGLMTILSAFMPVMAAGVIGEGFVAETVMNILLGVVGSGAGVASTKIGSMAENPNTSDQKKFILRTISGTVGLVSSAFFFGLGASIAMTGAKLVSATSSAIPLMGSAIFGMSSAALSAQGSAVELAQNYGYMNTKEWGDVQKILDKVSEGLICASMIFGLGGLLFRVSNTEFYSTNEKTDSKFEPEGMTKMREEISTTKLDVTNEKSATALPQKGTGVASEVSSLPPKLSQFAEENAPPSFSDLYDDNAGKGGSNEPLPLKNSGGEKSLIKPLLGIGVTTVVVTLIASFMGWHAAYDQNDRLVKELHKNDKDRQGNENNSGMGRDL